jgi:lipopolysaccharide export system protein LptA
MASPGSRLSRWFALGAILMIAIVAGMYFYARLSLRNAVHAVPAKLGLNIQQTADGFSISKSGVEGRTQFTVNASKAVQFKEGGRAELHDVKIIIYGKDSSRFDRITGDDFEFDPKSGEINAKGRVLIDLEANPEGVKHSDQAPPEQTKNPIHLETDGLIFNKNTGDASATGKVVFQTPQATGSAVGINYVAKTGRMDLLSSVVMTVNRPQPVHLDADRGVITKQPHQVFLTTVHVKREQQEMWSQQATFFLREDDTVDHILAEGDVRSEIHGRTSSSPKSHAQFSNSASSSSASSNSASMTTAAPPTSETHERSDQAELFLTGTRNLLTKAILTGNVQIASLGAQPADADAGRVTLQFATTPAGEQQLQTVHAEDGVRLTQKNSQSGTVMAKSSASPASASSGSPASSPSPALISTKASTQDQDVEMTAPVMDFLVKDGRLLENAETSGPPQIVITQQETNQKTVVTAARFTAKFTEKNRLATLHGEPDARIVSGPLDATKLDASKMPPKSGAPVPADRVSTSHMLDVVFLPQGGISSITQTGDLVYVDGPQKAWAQRGEYTATDQLLVLNGSPRVVNNGMTTTAQTMRMNRATGDSTAEGNVKTTYSELKPQPNGALLASSDPIHVTSRSMTAQRSSAVAVYTGEARLWQDANIVEAPVLRFDRDHRSLIAEAAPDAKQNALPKNPAQPVSTVLVQVDKTGKVTPVHITSARLNYVDTERKIFLDGGVTAKATDATLTSELMTVFLRPRNPSQPQAGSATAGQIDHIIAQNNVVVTEPTRRATGDRLVYTSDDDKFVLTGGPPSIFDAEQGKTTGDSLTFYRHDDRVLVESKGKSPTVTRTQVAR